MAIDFSRLNKAIDGAFVATAAHLDTALRESIEANVYEWPRVTKRRNRQTVGSPRDIVDTGELRDSQSSDRTAPNQFVFTWDADHALLVLQGWVSRNGLEMPARDWITPAIEKKNLAEVFSDELRARL